MLQFHFPDKTIFITGGSRGIGRACAVLFANAGARVIFTYKKDAAAANETLSLLPHKEQHRALQLNLSQPEQIENCFAQLQQIGARIDVVVNNAGIFQEHKILEVDYHHWQQQWKETLDTNLTGVANVCYFAARSMQAQGGGTIINISSRGAFRGEPHHPAYGASKAGLNSLTQSLALALGPHNIIVAAVAPGFVETDMATAYLSGPEGEQIKSQSPLGRVATANEVAHAVAVLTSEPFMTGAIIDVNGASYLRS